MLDGNQKPPVGAQALLFSNPGPLGNHELSPDIILAKNEVPLCVIEIKYKPCPKKPDRDHIEQLLTYALGYNIKRAALLYPAAENQGTTLTRLGIVNEVECFKITLDLSADDLSESENELRSLVYGEFTASGNGR